MIAAFFLSLWSRIQGWVLGAAAIVAALGGVFLLGRSKGKDQAQSEAQAANTKAENEALNTALDAAKERSDVDTKISAMPDSDVSDALNEWMRDDTPDNKGH